MRVSLSVPDCVCISVSGLLYVNMFSCVAAQVSLYNCQCATVTDSLCGCPVCLCHCSLSHGVSRCLAVSDCRYLGPFVPLFVCVAVQLSLPAMSLCVAAELPPPPTYSESRESLEASEFPEPFNPQFYEVGNACIICPLCMLQCIFRIYLIAWVLLADSSVCLSHCGSLSLRVSHHVSYMGVSLCLTDCLSHSLCLSLCLSLTVCHTHTINHTLTHTPYHLYLLL